MFSSWLSCYIYKAAKHFRMTSTICRCGNIAITIFIKWNGSVPKKQSTWVLQWMTEKNPLVFLHIETKHCDRSIKKKYYEKFVRTILEYSHSIWSPYHKIEINKLGQVQRRAASIMNGNYNKPSELLSKISNGCYCNKGGERGEKANLQSSPRKNKALSIELLLDQLQRKSETQELCRQF